MTKFRMFPFGDALHRKSLIVTVTRTFTGCSLSFGTDGMSNRFASKRFLLLFTCSSFLSEIKDPYSHPKRVVADVDVTNDAKFNSNLSTASTGQGETLPP